MATARPNSVSVLQCFSCQVASVTMLCNCASPPLGLCSLCLLAHVATTGTHVLSALPPTPPKPSTQNLFCHLCNSVPPDIVCPCVLPAVSLCKQCIPSHLSKSPLALHTCLPIEALSFIVSQKYPQELADKRDRVESAKKQFEQNLRVIDDCEAYIDKTFKTIIDNLTGERNALKSEIAAARERLNQTQSDAVSSLEQSIYDTRFSPDDPTGKLILKTTDSAHDLALISVEKSPFTAPNLSNLVKITLKLPTAPSNSTFENHSLACVFPDCIQRYDCIIEEWKAKVSLSENIESDSGTCLCFIEDCKVFASGRYTPTSASAYFINTDSGVVARLPLMITARCQHGLVYTRSCIYVFGGYTDQKSVLSQCEKLTIATRQWSALPSLSAGKNCFNPCLIGAKVFIVAGRLNPNIEVFNLDSESFESISLYLPPMKGKTTKSDLAVCCFVDNSDVVALRVDGEFRFGGKSGGGGLRSKRLQGFYPWSNANPVVVDGKVYTIPFWLRTLMKYDMAAGKWTRVQ